MKLLNKQFTTNVNRCNLLTLCRLAYFRFLFTLFLLTGLTACHEFPIPNTPVAPTLEVVSSSQINLSWASVKKHQYSRLYRELSENGSYVEIRAFTTILEDNGSYRLKIKAYTNNLEDIYLNAGTNYSYKLRTCFMFIPSCSSFSSIVNATTMISIKIKLNDTGITWGGDYIEGNNNGSTPSCNSVDTTNSDALLAKQDCHYGRDAQATAGTLIKIGGGQAGFDFTKLASNGTALNNQNATWDDNGTEASGTRWSCVRDNHTGYVWEVKNNDRTANIHHKDNKYRWGGLTAIGKNHADKEGSYYSDWNELVNGANQDSYGGNTGLCGYTDWRTPNPKELMTIAHKGKIDVTIDTDYFPNTKSSYYWSSSPNANNSSYAWLIYFRTSSAFGAMSLKYRNDNNYVRLVRAGQ